MNNYLVAASVFDSLEKQQKAYEEVNNPLELDYCTRSSTISAESKDEAVSIFQNMSIYINFCERHLGKCVYTYVKQGYKEKYERVDLLCNKE